MAFGKKLFELRKQAGFSQEMLAEKVGVSRQTVSKWELNEVQPEMIKGKLLAELYGVTYDSLINDTPNVTKITDMAAVVDEIDWTSAWSEKYPILTKYHEDPKAKLYIKRIFEMYDEMKKEMDLSEVDTFLAMKDMVYQRYKQFTKKKK
jgi:transcriptional regulator with XRE-family HTH domain